MGITELQGEHKYNDDEEEKEKINAERKIMCQFILFYFFVVDGGAGGSGVVFVK